MMRAYQKGKRKKKREKRRAITTGRGIFLSFYAFLPGYYGAAPRNPAL